MEHYIILAAATMYISICVAVKMGPENIFYRFREWTKRKIGNKSPFDCAFCTMPYALMLFLAIDPIFPEVKYFFGILGIASALRGASQEYN